MILIISSVFPPEPVVSATISHEIALSLSNLYKVKVLTPKPTRPLGFQFPKETILNDKFDHEILDSFTYPRSKIFGRMIESFSFGKNAVKHIRKNYKEIESIYLHAWPLLSQYQIVKAARKYSIPIVVRIVDIYPESLLDKLKFARNFFIKILLPIDRYALRNATKVITLSPGMRAYLIKSRDLKNDKVEVVHNWQNEENFITYRNSQRIVSESADFTFMFLGNLNRTAAIDFLITVFQTGNLNNVRLVIAGNGSEKETLVSLADQNKNARIVFWEAPVRKVPELQDKADVLLLNLKKGASRFALPSKLPAYMFSAKPIIACVEEDSDTANAIMSAQCGWIIPPEDPDALLRAIQNAINTPQEELNRMGANGFSYAIKNFSRHNNIPKMTEILVEASGSRTMKK